MTTDLLRQLATIRQAWPTKKQFHDEVIKPRGPDGFQLSPTHVLRLAPLNKNDAEIKLRRELVAQAIQHQWAVRALWERIRDGRQRLGKQRPARKQRAAKWQSTKEAVNNSDDAPLTG